MVLSAYCEADLGLCFCIYMYEDFTIFVKQISVPVSGVIKHNRHGCDSVGHSIKPTKYFL